MGWLVSGAAAFLLAALPLGIWIRYDSGGPLVRVVAGPIKITLYPRPQPEKKVPEKSKQVPDQPQERSGEAALPSPPQPPPAQTVQEQPKGGSISDFMPFVKLGVDLLGDVRRKLRLDEFYLRLILASSDPCDLAVSYGRVWTAVGNLMPQLERLFVIKKRDVEVECDFTASQTLVMARLQITITLGRLLALLSVYGVRGIKEFLNFKKKRKGGAQ